MKKAIKLVIMLVIMVIALTGCVNVDYQITINEDGTGNVTYIYGFEKSKLETLGMTVDQMLENLKTEAMNNQYIVEKYEDDTIGGFKASKNIEDVTTGVSLEEAFGEQYVKDSENNQIKIVKEEVKRNRFQTKYSQNAEIDLTKMEDMKNYTNMRYVINLPVAVDANKTNASEISEDAKTLTWNLVAGEINRIQFEAVSKAQYKMTVIDAIIIALVVIVLILAVVVINKKSKKKQKNIVTIKKEIKPEIDEEKEENKPQENEEKKEENNREDIKNQEENSEEENKETEQKDETKTEE